MSDQFNSAPSPILGCLPVSLTVSDTSSATQETLHSSSTDKKDANETGNSDSHVGADEENHKKIRILLSTSSDSFGAENSVDEFESSYESSASRIVKGVKQKNMFYLVLDDDTNDLDSSLDKRESSYYSVDPEEKVDGFM